MTLNKRKSLNDLAGTLYDVAIIGGGINGTGLARELALRGIKTILLEKGDLGSGTSSQSSKLVHGGLRYLEQGHFSLVKEALKERFNLLHNAPHLVTPLPFIIPIYKNGNLPKWKVRLGLTLYDSLAGFKNIKPHKWLSTEDALQRAPYLNSEGLIGAAVYYDAQMNDARLCLENGLQANHLGAHVLNYCKVMSCQPHGKHIYEITAYDDIAKVQGTIKAKKVVNTTGPWTNETVSLLGINEDPLVSASKGSHVVTKQFTTNHAILLQAKSDQRIFFVLPNSDSTTIGTTETAVVEDLDNLAISKEEKEYLLKEVNGFFPDVKLTESDVISSFSGVRPLIRSKGSLGKTSREHKLVQHSDGLFSLVGGKYTTYRRIAETTAKALFRALNVKFPGYMTSSMSLYGGEIENISQYIEVNYPLEQSIYPVSKEVYAHIIHRYGSAYQTVLSVLCEHGMYIEHIGTTPNVKGEVIYAIRFEMAQKIEDFMRRRTELFFKPGNGRQVLDIVADMFQKELGWNDLQKEIEKKDYLTFVNRNT